MRSLFKYLSYLLAFFIVMSFQMGSNLSSQVAQQAQQHAQDCSETTDGQVNLQIFEEDACLHFSHSLAKDNRVISLHAHTFFFSYFLIYPKDKPPRV